MVTDTDEEILSNDRFYTMATSNIIYKIGKFSNLIMNMLQL